MQHSRRHAYPCKGFDLQRRRGGALLRDRPAMCGPVSVLSNAEILGQKRRTPRYCEARAELLRWPAMNKAKAYVSGRPDGAAPHLPCRA